MNGYSTKNYTTDSGNTLVIGGTLRIEEGATVEGLPAAPHIPMSDARTVAELKDDLNVVLAALISAGLMQGEPETEAGPDEDQQDNDHDG